MFITAWEVAKYSPVGKDFPPDKISPHIDTCEENLKDCFGEDFFDLLVDDLKADANVYSEYQPGKSYLIGDKVIHLGIRYEALANTSKVPGTSPLDWEQWENFTTAEYNTLWVKYLRRYLAMDIALPAVTLATYPATGKGIMIHQDQNTGTATASPGQVSTYKNELLNQRDSIKKHMIAYMTKVHKDAIDAGTASPYALASFLDDTDCTGNGCKSAGGRRILWRQ